MDSKGRVSVSIERLASWAYRDCLVHRMDRGSLGLNALEAAQDGILLHKSSGDGVMQCIRQAELGTRIAGGSGLVPIMDAPSDAIALHRYVLSLEPAVGRLVVVNGAFGAWPDWMAEARADGLRVIPGRSRTVGRDQRSWCEVEIVDDGRAMRLARERYATWWYALWGALQLFRSKPDLLTRHRVVTQDAPVRPWEMAGTPVFVGVDLGRKPAFTHDCGARRGLAA